MLLKLRNNEIYGKFRCIFVYKSLNIWCKASRMVLKASGISYEKSQNHSWAYKECMIALQYNPYVYITYR